MKRSPMTPVPDALLPVLNLAKARELLLLEAKTHMPPGARAQRDHTIRTLEATIAQALAAAREPLPAIPAAADAIGRAGWNYILQAHSLPAAAARTPYRELRQAFDRHADLELAAELLHWVESTHALPDISGDAIADALVAIGIFEHRLLTAPAATAAVEELRRHPDLPDDAARRNFSLMARQWAQATALSESLVEELSRANLASFRIWEKARPRGDFAEWLPAFKAVVRLGRRKAEALGQALGVAPYQALLEQYNPGLRNDTVNHIFAALQEKLPPLIERISRAQATQEKPLPLPPVAVAAQRRIVKRLIDAMGFDERYCRIDESAHPFSTGEWDDVRITTRYIENNPLSGIMSVVHELGHMFYSMNLPRQWKGQPVGAAQSMWVHESQSLFWEKQIAGSLEFMEFLSPIIRRELDADGPPWSAGNLHRLITRVQPGLIRIEADEVTYPAHIILRHRLEQALVAGTLAPEDLPAAWAEQMRLLLRVGVPDHAHGCMQDVHWTDGTFGYFPAYSFGALAAAQLMQKVKRDLPDIAPLVRRGDFAPIRGWLAEHIHRYGSLYEGEELLARATGHSLSIQPWIDQAEARYLPQ